MNQTWFSLFLKCPDFNKRCEKILRTKFYVQIRIFVRIYEFLSDILFTSFWKGVNLRIFWRNNPEFESKIRKRTFFHQAISSRIRNIRLRQCSTQNPPPPRLFWLKLARGGGVVLVPPGNVSSCKCFKDYLLWFNNASRLVGTSHETLKFLINHLGRMSSSVGWELAWKNGKLALNILRGWSRIVRVPFCVTLERVVGKLSTALMTVKVDEREKREDRSERTMKVFKAEWN